MRTVLIGSDFMYDKDGSLKPIEINTAVGWDGIEKIEDDVDCLDLTGLYDFVSSSNFQTIHYIGDIPYFHKTLETHYTGSSVSYYFHGVTKHSITIPYIEDNETTLIIRSAYDTTALVDDTYCRDKVNFMNLIKDSSFGSQFAYIDDSNTLVSNITTINDNGEHPNFILKSRLPGYETNTFPKFFKVSNQTELDTVVSENVTTDYFLMENYVNEEKVWNGHLKLIRSLNLLYPPSLQSIQLGQYTKISHNSLQENVTYDDTTFELNSLFRESYLTNLETTWIPKLLDTDTVEMEDGTFKTALELEVGDVIKTIDIPNSNSSIQQSPSEYIYSGLTYGTLSSNTTYSTNEVTQKKKVNRLTILVTLTFEDGSTWEDTGGSSYLVDIDGVIQFKLITKLKQGDVVLLLNSNNDEIEFTRKTIVSCVENRSVFSGWLISVAVAKLFLTKTTTSTGNEAYVSIEHNLDYCPSMACICPGTCASCPKSAPYCGESGVCSNGQQICA
jgi:hypothetical protein